MNARAGESAGFHDHFSKVATGYSAYRPTYPDKLFDDLVALIGSNAASESVWDCAAGSGQASLALGNRFAHVLATDASISQISSAPKHPRVSYAAARAESCPMPAASVALVTVAQSLHWFKFDTFYSEAKRVLKPNGVLAVWSYALLRVDSNPQLERAVYDFSEQTLKGWWPAERRYVDEEYRTIPFQLERIEFPEQNMTASWKVDQLLGYLRTWSSVSKRHAADGVDPVATFEPELREAWGSATALTMRWPLAVLVGRV